MKCNGCGEEFHGAASCQANLRWLLDRAREEIVRLKTVSPSFEVPSLLQGNKMLTLAEFKEALNRDLSMMKPKLDRSAHMKEVWRKRKLATKEV